MLSPTDLIDLAESVAVELGANIGECLLQTSLAHGLEDIGAFLCGMSPCPVPQETTITNLLSKTTASGIAEFTAISVQHYQEFDSIRSRREAASSPGERRFFVANGVACLFLSVGHLTRDVECLNKTVVAVLGMHRSGTSSTAGTLVRLGGAAPLHLVAAAADNETGFWESQVIVDLNDAILAAGRSDWKDWRKFNLEEIDAVEADGLRARAKAALAEEFGDVGLAVMKDPRMCRLMPFWAPVFEEARWSVRALLPIRSPLEVGWSLNCRDGIGSAYGCLLWLRHVLDAEAETRGMARAVLDWPQFLGDGRKALARASEQLGLIWPYWGESALADIDRFVSDDLRHQRASEADLRAHPAVNDLVRETYDAMIDLVRDSGDTCVLRRLDDLRAGFERASAIFDCPMRELNEEVRRTRSRAAAEIARANEEVRRARLQAAAEIVRADAIIARIADRGRGKSCDSKRTGARSFWRPRSKAAAGAKDLEVIRNSLFFDSAYYLETNPDVRAAGADAAFHYLVHGGQEGRDPGPFFSTRVYLARYPDVAEAGLNALLHYETRGRRENRIAAA